MKRITCTAVTLTASLFFAGHANANLTDGLVGYFDFQNDFSNAAGSVDGMGLNGATAGTAGGIAGRAMGLRNGGGTANEHMNVGIGVGGTVTDSNLGETFTISAWYNLDQPPTGSSSNRYFVLETETGFDVSYGIRDSVTGTPGINDAQTFVASGAPNNVVWPDAGTSGWHHVVLTYSPVNASFHTVKTYIDGTLQASEILVDPSTVDDTGINFGAPRSSVTDRGFDGLIDEVGLWSRALSDSEVAELYRFNLNGGSIPEPASLALLGLGGVMVLRRSRK